MSRDEQPPSREPSPGAREQGLEFTARRLAVQLDLLILAIEEGRPPDQIHELCREGRVTLDYAAMVLGEGDVGA